jgi:hypothetical protein
VRLLAVVILAAVALFSVVAIMGGRHQAPVKRVHPTPDAVPVPARDPVTVASGFLAALTPRVLLDPVRRRALLERWADQDAWASLDRAYSIEADRVRATYGGLPLVSRSALLGYRTAPTGHDRLDVSIWAVGLAAGRAGTGAAGWSTVTVTLRDRGGAWRVSAVRAAAGPQPTDPGAVLARAAASFHPFSHAR